MTDELDNCDVTLDATYTDFRDSTNLCDIIITRFWTLTDDCNNTTTHIQTITIVPSTGISNIPDHTNFLVYPNPSNGTFNLEYTIESGKVSILVTDITGKEVYQEVFLNPIMDIKETLDLSNSGPGVYFLRLVSDLGVLHRRLVVE